MLYTVIFFEKSKVPIESRNENFRKSQPQLKNRKQEKEHS
jgi:hypothetical protein